MFEYWRLKRMVKAGWSTSVSGAESFGYVNVTLTRGNDRVKLMLTTRVAEKILAYDKEN